MFCTTCLLVMNINIKCLHQQNCKRNMSCYMKTCFALVFLSLLAGQGSSLYPHQQRRFLGRSIPANFHNSGKETVSAPPYTVGHVSQVVDHFNSSDTRTFSQRYLVYDKYWDKNGPIFVYTGNEGDIVWFFQNTVSAKSDQLIALF